MNSKPLELHGIGDVEAAIQTLHNLRQKKKETEELMEYYKEAIKAYLKKNGLTSYSTAATTTTLTTGKRRIFDTKRFGYEHPDLRKKYMVDVDFELLTYRAF